MKLTIGEKYIMLVASIDKAKEEAESDEPVDKKEKMTAVVMELTRGISWAHDIINSKYEVR